MLHPFFGHISLRVAELSATYRHFTPFELALETLGDLSQPQRGKAGIALQQQEQAYLHNQMATAQHLAESLTASLVYKKTQQIRAYTGSEIYSCKYKAEINAV